MSDRAIAEACFRLDGDSEYRLVSSYEGKAAHLLLVWHKWSSPEGIRVLCSARVIVTWEAHGVPMHSHVKGKPICEHCLRRYAVGKYTNGRSNR